MASPISILTVSASLHLSGNTISSILAQQWSLASPEVTARFENVGYQVDPNDATSAIAGLREVFKERDWDGIIFGWCVRGHVEFTELFEKLVQVAFEEMLFRKSERAKRNDIKIMFTEGPEGLVKAAMKDLFEVAAALCNSDFLSLPITPWFKYVPKIPAGRYLSLCLKAVVQYHPQGFKLAQRSLDHSWGGAHAHLAPPCGCPCASCFALGLLTRDLKGRVIEVRELDLRIHLSTYCEGVNGTAGGRSIMPAKLVCVDTEEMIDAYVKVFCEQKLLAMLMRLAIGKLNVNLVYDMFEHPYTWRPTCWCAGRDVDEMNLRSLGIATKIKARLMSGHAPKSSTA